MFTKPDKMYTLGSKLQLNIPESEEKDRGHKKEVFYSVSPASAKKAAREEASHYALQFLAEIRVPAAVSALEVFGVSVEKSVLFKKPFEGSAEENKNLEFKGGPKPDNSQSFDSFFRMFKESLGRYVCAFRNGDDNRKSRICYGVHDLGVVQGVIFNNVRVQKDQVRREYDRQMYLFYPVVVNRRDVLLEFLSVRDGPGQNGDGLLIVVCVSILQRRMSPNLCWWNSNAFLRSEGSVRQMSPTRIEAHYKKIAWEEVSTWLSAQIKESFI